MSWLHFWFLMSSLVVLGAVMVALDARWGPDNDE